MFCKSHAGTGVKLREYSWFPWRSFLHIAMQHFLHHFLLSYLLPWCCTDFPFATFIHFYSPMGTNAAFSNAKPRRQMMKKGTSNEEDRQAWIRFVNRINWVRWKHARLCLLHFDDTYIKYEPEVTANPSYPCWCQGPSLPSGEHDINIPAKCPSGFHPGKQISQWR